MIQHELQGFDLDEEKVPDALVPRDGMIAVGYCRSSTEIQEYSISEQKKDIKKQAQMCGYFIKQFYIDHGLSGTSMVNRPALQRMLRELVPGIVVVIREESRLARNFDESNILHREIRNKECILVITDAQKGFYKKAQGIVMDVCEIYRIERNSELFGDPAIEAKSREHMYTLFESLMTRMKYNVDSQSLVPTLCLHCTDTSNIPYSQFYDFNGIGWILPSMDKYIICGKCESKIFLMCSAVIVFSCE